MLLHKLWWFLPYINMNLPQVYICPILTWDPLPSYSVPLDCPWELALCALLHASNLHWSSILCKAMHITFFHPYLIGFISILSNHPIFTFSSWVQNLFFKFLSHLLPCMSDCWCNLSKYYICALIYGICLSLTYFTQ